jgi:hypothetical protein
MSRRERIRRFVDGELELDEQLSLLSQAEDDPKLAKLLDEARVVDRHVRALRTHDPMSPPADLIERAIARATVDD